MSYLIGHYLFQVLNPLLWDALLYTQSSRTVNTQLSGFYLEVLEIQKWAYFLPIYLEGVPLLLRILNHAGLKDEKEWLSPPSAPSDPLGDQGDSVHYASWSTFFPVCYFPELNPQFQAKCQSTAASSHMDPNGAQGFPWAKLPMGPLL